MYCPQCGAALPEGATYCTQCAAVVKPVDHIVKTLGRVTKDLASSTNQALDRAAKVVQPAVDKTVKTIQPAMVETARALKPVPICMRPDGSRPT